MREKSAPATSKTAPIFALDYRRGEIKSLRYSAGTIMKLSLLLFGILACASAPHLTTSAAEQPPTLSSCSLRYGYLMADHWLTTDLAQQIERSLFYRAQ